MRKFIFVAALALLPVVAAAQSPQAANLIAKEATMNEACGMGSVPKACAERDSSLDQLRALGWCHGGPGVPAYQAVWHRCGGDK